MHDCRQNGANTGDDGHEYLDRELGTDFFLDSFLADKRRFPPERPSDDAGRDLLEQFQALMCKQPRWRKEECVAWVGLRILALGGVSVLFRVLGFGFFFLLLVREE